MSVVCTVCNKAIEPDDMDVRRCRSSDLLYHAPCYVKLEEALAEADRRLLLRADMAHINGGYCPVCRAWREAGSICWGE